jgi:CheY-like chemotaxis protein
MSEDTYRALVVDDHPGHRQLFFAILTSLGVTVDLAADGAEAILAATARPYELILMDVSMPNVDGLEATRRIREHEVASGSPRANIIMVTSHSAPEDYSRSQAVGADGHVTKPVDIAGLMAVIEDRYLSAA